MYRNRLIATLFALVAASSLYAAPQSGETIPWQNVGASTASGSSTNFQLSGSLGQPAAGFVDGSTIDINQGFWQNFGCCVGTRGNVDLKGIIDLSDLSLLIDYMTIIPPRTLPCPEAADVNAKGIIDLSDLSLLILYLVQVPPPTLPTCP